MGKKVGKKVGEKVGKKTGEKVGESLGDIHKLNLVPTTHLDATKGISQFNNSSLKGFIASSEIIRTLTKGHRNTKLERNNNHELRKDLCLTL